jgi:hypothetical protein
MDRFQKTYPRKPPLIPRKPAQPPRTRGAGGGDDPHVRGEGQGLRERDDSGARLGHLIAVDGHCEHLFGPPLNTFREC